MLRKLIQHEAAGGVLLMISAALALVVANSPAAGVYSAAQDYPLLDLSLLHWINDALMAVFFLLVGLEIKRELLEGSLDSWPHRILPGVGAAGGMLAPALVYLAVNAASPDAWRGWAIPTATDIAFSLGVLALLGSRVPASLKVFLTALAILDDLGAIVVIAVFYTHGIVWPMLGLAAAALALLHVLNYAGVRNLTPYLVVGAALWFFVLKSGIHATIAGVLLATAIPLRGARSPLHALEHALQPWVTFLILPLFGFANAGVKLTGGGSITTVTLGCALGLFVGKQLGIFGAVYAAVGAGAARKPAGASWLQIYGVALLCGIGFTMSLFIGLLAFDAMPPLENESKLGVLAGSVLSGIVGYFVLRASAQGFINHRKR